MISKKICMLGAFATGKTSMVSRFVLSAFSEKYLTTVGVKVDKKIMKVGAQDVTLMIWDLAGEDEFQKVQMSYFRGAAGFLLVVDGTRRSTLETGLTLIKRVEETIGKIPFLVILNKVDLVDSWEVNQSDIDELIALGWPVIRGSAKTGEGVEDAFELLARKLVGE